VGQDREIVFTALKAVRDGKLGCDGEVLCRVCSSQQHFYSYFTYPTFTVAASELPAEGIPEHQSHL